LFIEHGGGVAIVTVAGVASTKTQLESYDGTSGALLLPAELASTSAVTTRQSGLIVHFKGTRGTASAFSPSMLKSKLSEDVGCSTVGHLDSYKNFVCID
jgi:hypothetical protein